jgi:solute carrier family 25 folate transporter 32
MCDVLRRTWTFEGAAGFYKGMTASLVRVTPATMATFYVYEHVSHVVRAHT